MHHWGGETLTVITTDYYARAIDLSDVAALEAEMRTLLERPIASVADLRQWLTDEFALGERIEEVYTGHLIDFSRDTEDAEKERVHVHDQTVVMPSLIRFNAEFDRKFCECPFTAELDDAEFGTMKRVRATNLELFRDANVPLQVREQELSTEYQTLAAGLTVEWEGANQPLPVVQALVDSPQRDIRRRAWEAVSGAYAGIKDRADEIMDELIQIRHQIAQNAGFANYRDYTFRERNREYTLADCQRFHAAVKTFLVPVWDTIAEDFRSLLDVPQFRPWDNSNCNLDKPPFATVDELKAGVERILQRIDPELAQVYIEMNNAGLLDLEGRKGKRPGGFCASLPISNTSFVFANFSPSFFALIALIHELGHALNNHYQFQRDRKWVHHRAEVAELFSHSMELLSLDKLDEFYQQPDQLNAAIQQRIRRSVSMLMGPLSGDVFQHWLYENPGHSRQERDAVYLKIQREYFLHPVDIEGIESMVAQNWIGVIHFFAAPFYTIEYSLAELGAIQVLHRYRDNAVEAIAGYKRGAGADYGKSIADVFRETGVRFDFSDDAIRETAKFVASFWASVHHK